MEKDLISVIIPIYNVEHYLKRCIESVVNQTYKNIEILLIDDGSTDNSGNICEEIKYSDSRIIVFHKENGGLSDARNYGIERAKGNYILFVDSDDYINIKMIEILYNNLIKTDSDISVCRPFKFEKEIEITENEKYDIEQELKVYDSIDIFRHMYDDYLVSVVAWNKLYKKKIFEDIRFPVGKLIEDSAILHYVFDRCNRIVYSNLELYYYFQRKNSIMHKMNYNLLDELDWLYDRILFFEKKKYIEEEFFKYTLDKYFETFNIWMYNLIKRNGYNKEHMNRYFYQFDEIYIKYGKKIECSELKEKFIVKFKFVFYWIKGLKALKNKTLRKIKNIQIYNRMSKRYKKYLKNENEKYVIFNAPNHGNIGDHAILFAEQEFLNKHAKNNIAIVHDEIEYFIEKYANTIKPEDVICITGGGNLGTLWEHEQIKVNKVLEKFKNNKIIIFPQTVTYGDNIHDIYRFNKDKAIYKQCSNLLFVCRDRKSYNFVSDNFQAKCLLTSDIVTYLDNFKSNKNRKNDIYLCFRNDKEKITKSQDINYIKEILNTNCKNNKIKNIDTVFKGYFTLSKGKKQLFKFLKKIGSCKLFITDRLHGMIFAAITGTPCIAMANSSGKVKGVYEWISKDNKYIKFLENLDDFEKYLNDIDFEKENIYNNEKIKEEFEKILK